MGTTALTSRGWWLRRLRLESNHANNSDLLLPFGSCIQPPPLPPPPPPTSTSADYTRGKLRLKLKLSLTLATTACPWPTTPATLAGPESEVLAPPPPGAHSHRGGDGVRRRLRGETNPRPARLLLP